MSKSEDEQVKLRNSIFGLLVDAQENTHLQTERMATFIEEILSQLVVDENGTPLRKFNTIRSCSTQDGSLFDI